MDCETMERLLIDRRLGELPPDTQRLLDAYLQVSPADATAAVEIDAVIDLAAQALRPEPPATPEELPPLSLASRVTSSPARPTRWIALAASVLLAFFLGTQWVKRPGAPMDRNIQIAATLSSSSLTPQASSLMGTEFWSVARYATGRSDLAPSPAVSSRIEWTSPLVWPQRGERL